MAGETLVAMFERTAAEHAAREAVSDQHHSLSYAELNARADQLAQVLVGYGIGREDRVASYRSRGIDVFVAILGILKAGAAYVAVDTRYPDSRRDLMIRNSGARLIVTEPGWSSRLQACGPAVLEWRSRPAVGATRARVEIGERDAACVLFTSGSSGTPKAIVLEHRNLVYFARNAALPPLQVGDRVGQVSSLSFDAFHFETWCSFAHGAEVVVLPAVADLIANDLQRELRRRRITAMLAPTMAANHVLHEDRDAFAALRVLHTGGDVLQPAAARALLAGSFAGEFCNLYGPSEATTACSGYRITQVAEGAASIPIGRELDGAAVYILDERLTEVPTASVGELHIGGRGVGRGYLGQPGLTADRFRPDPFGQPGSRMYATGDLARRRADGVLEFLGRADDQVKVRGYRVEPREVERVLARHPGVLDVAVIVSGEHHDRHLVALVVLREGFPPNQLREFASATMPDYLVPGTFVRVPQIPGNDHGKRDLDRLRQLAAEHLRRQDSRVQPRDGVERYLADLWEQLLAVERVGANDDFFALGGNSMLAFRASRRIRRDLQVSLDVREILQASELSGLASLIRGRMESVHA